MQTIVVCGAVSLLVRNEPLLLRLQVVIWLIFVNVVAWRFGLTEQQGFYSNDQSYWTNNVNLFVTLGIPFDVDVWLGTKIIFPVAALPLVESGVHQVLALKTVSLLCLLTLSRRILRDTAAMTTRDQALTLWLSACGTIGLFFSTLALRETMMMYFVYNFATNRSMATRMFSLVALYILRPHLAAAVFVAEVMMLAWRWLRNNCNLGVAESPILIALGVTAGTTLYFWGSGGTASSRTPFTGDWGIVQATRIASNFVGLQFLTVPDRTVNFSVSSLLFLRIFLCETIVVPVLFTTICLFAYRWLDDRDRFALLAFTLYVTVVIATDYNSFRQNLPLIPLMGLTIVKYLRLRQIKWREVSNYVDHHTDVTVTPRGM